MRLFLKFGITFIALLFLYVIIGIMAYAFEARFEQAGVMFLLAVYVSERVGVELHNKKEDE